MRRGSTLIGFTEAELGFVIAAVLAFAAWATSARPPEGVVRPGDSVDPVAVDSAHTRQGTLSGDDSSDAVSPDSALSRPDTLSREEVRACSELKALGLPRSPVARIAILGEGRYFLAPDTMTLATLNARLARAEAEAVRLQCKYYLNFRPPPDMPYRAYIAALAPFQSRFKVRANMGD